MIHWRKIIMFGTCPENDATHVEIIADKDENYIMSNLTSGKVYEILEDDEPGHEGEEMIRADNGDFLCDFSLYIEVLWLKKLI